MVEKEVATQLAEAVVRVTKKMLGDEATQRGDDIDVKSKWFNMMVNERHAARIKTMLDEDHGGQVLMGGSQHISGKFVPATVVLNPKLTSSLMTTEIFGPVLVLYTVSGADEAISLMKKICPTPLALYVYSEDRAYTERVRWPTAAGEVRERWQGVLERHSGQWTGRPLRSPSTAL